MIPVSVGIVYLWFGALKFFSGVSPAETLAQQTIQNLTFNLIDPSVSIILLALWETTIGILLLLTIWRRTALLLALLHIILTFTPFLFFPELVFTNIPFGLTLLGQYIIKNVIILGVLLVLLKKGE
jgi:uncharacterized membrane protein YkgB